jgi:hypothetical protein
MVSIFTPIVLVLVVVMMVLTGSAGAVTTLEITHGFAALILPGQANDVSWSFGGVDCILRVVMPVCLSISVPVSSKSREFRTSSVQTIPSLHPHATSIQTSI